MSNPVITTTLPYAVHDGVTLLGDLYQPDAPGPHPIVLAVPGGGWRGCRRDGLRHWAMYLAAHGVAVFVIEYRTSVEAPSFPQAVLDVIAALRFVSGQASVWQVDPSRLGVLAASAGAHLATLAVLAHDHPLVESRDPDDSRSGSFPKVHAFVLAYGVYDLVAHWQQTRATVTDPASDVTLRFMGVTPDEDVDRYRLASPVTHLAAVPHRTAWLLTWGTNDRFVAPAQTEAFASLLRARGFETAEYPISGAGHHWFSQHDIADTGGLTAALAPKVLEFLLSHLHTPQHTPV